MKEPKPTKLPSGNWFTRVQLGGKRYPVTAATEKECIRTAMLMKAEYLAGARVERLEKKKRSPTLSEAIDQYIEQRDAVLSPSTIRGYRSIQRNCFPTLMPKPLDKITATDCQTACNLEAKRHSAKTLKNAWGFVSSVYAAVAGQPAPKVKLA